MGDSVRKILLACHDAGSANCIGAFSASAPSEVACTVVGAGPAVGVLSRFGITPLCLSDSDEPGAINSLIGEMKPDAVIVGTSRTAMLERLVIRCARARGLPSIGIVDWWSDYAARFSSNGTRDLMFLPSVVAVSDEIARAGAMREGVPEGSLLISGNPYWDYLQRDWNGDQHSVMQVREFLGVQSDTIVVAVVFGMARHFALNLGCDEEDLVDVLHPLIQETSEGRLVHWVGLRHPAEPLEEFERFIASKMPGMKYLHSVSSLDVVRAADCVIGLISTLQFEAALLRKPVLSLLPGGDFTKMPFVEVFRSCGIPTCSVAKDGRRAVLQLLQGDGRGLTQSVLPRSIVDGSAVGRIVEAITQVSRVSS